MPGIIKESFQGVTLYLTLGFARNALERILVRSRGIFFFFNESGLIVYEKFICSIRNIGTTLASSIAPCEREYYKRVRACAQAPARKQ